MSSYHREGALAQDVGCNAVPIRVTVSIDFVQAKQSTMRDSWQSRTAFWVAIFVSCLWLVFTIAFGFAGIRSFIGPGIRPIEREPLEILIAAIFVLQPFFILILIVRAIRLREVGQPLRIVARAVYPSVPVILFVPYVKALLYLADQSGWRRVQMWWSIGTVTYDCSPFWAALESDSKKIGVTTLRLTEARHSGKSNWIVEWPTKKPIEAMSFPAHTGSIGGSQGIKWREPDGRRVVAYISFSDIMTEHGPGTIWMWLTQGGVAGKDVSAYTARMPDYICASDPSSYRE